MILMAVLVLTMLIGCQPRYDQTKLAYCEEDSDCVLTTRHMCHNEKRFMKFDRGMPEDFKFPKACECTNNMCYPKIPQTEWFRQNATGKNIMAWWDYGRALENAGAIPFIKEPSESILSTMGSFVGAKNKKSFKKKFEKEHGFEEDWKIEQAIDFFTTTDMNRMQCILKENDIDYIYLPDEMTDIFAAIMASRMLVIEKQEEGTPFGGIRRIDFSYSNTRVFQDQRINMGRIYYKAEHKCDINGIYENDLAENVSLPIDWYEIAKQTDLRGCIAPQGKKVYYVSSSLMNSSINHMLFLQDLGFLTKAKEFYAVSPEENRIHPSYYDIIYKVEKEKLVCN